MRARSPALLLCIIGLVLALSQPAAEAQTAAPDTPPKANYTTCTKPNWPEFALGLQQQGPVSFSFLIGVDGKVLESKINNSSGFPLLDYVAQHGISRCNFTPAMKDGQPVQAWMQMTYIWTLDEGFTHGSVDWREVEAKAALGDAAFEYKLAFHYQDGRNSKRDPKEALRLLRSASAKNHVPSQLALAILLSSNHDRDPHRDEVIDLYDKAAASGSARAKYMLAVMLIDRPTDAKALSDAEAALRSASLQNYYSALAPLGVLLVQKTADASKQAEGIGVLRWAAGQHDPVTQGELGSFIEKGLGVKQDYAEAASLYAKAIRGGYIKVQPALARLYELGLGVPQNPAKAIELRKAVATWNKQAN